MAPVPTRLPQKFKPSSRSLREFTGTTGKRLIYCLIQAALAFRRPGKPLKENPQEVIQSHTRNLGQDGGHIYGLRTHIAPARKGQNGDGL